MFFIVLCVIYRIFYLIRNTRQHVREIKLKHIADFQEIILDVDGVLIIGRLLLSILTEEALEELIKIVNHCSEEKMVTLASLDDFLNPRYHSEKKY